METNKKVCVVVPVFNRLECTKIFIESFARSTYKNYTILIFDDGSTDGTSEYLAKHHPDIIVLKGDGNYWWSASTNEGVKYALDNNYDYVLTINNDATVDKDLLKNLVSCAEVHPKSVVGARVMLGDSAVIWSLGVMVHSNVFRFLSFNQYGADESIIEQLQNPLPMDALTGNGTLVPTEIYKEIGLYDSKWCPQYHGDSEFTYRATLNGFQCFVELDALLYNHGFMNDQKLSFKDELFNKKSAHYWRPLIKFYFGHFPMQYRIFLLAQFIWIPKKILQTILRRP